MRTGARRLARGERLWVDLRPARRVQHAHDVVHERVDLGLDGRGVVVGQTGSRGFGWFLLPLELLEAALGSIRRYQEAAVELLPRLDQADGVEHALGLRLGVAAEQSRRLLGDALLLASGALVQDRDRIAGVEALDDVEDEGVHLGLEPPRVAEGRTAALRLDLVDATLAVR